MRAAEQASATLKAIGPSIFGPFTVAGMRPAYCGTVRIQTHTPDCPDFSTGIGGATIPQADFDHLARRTFTARKADKVLDE
jgi:hypothetical protein